MRQVILYIAMSLDGYIAREDDNLDFLARVERPGEDYGYEAFQQTVDTVIWGRRTYEKVLTFGQKVLHPGKKIYVLSRTRTGYVGNVEFYGGDPKALIASLREQKGKHIYCDGGGEVVAALLKEHLIDKLIVSVIPHLLGSGIRLFRDGRPEHLLTLTKSLTFPSGLVQLWYDRLPDAASSPNR
ncbi:dihydrofolate reductase family protein [Rufibacter glacialis]|uniref:Dihydrofolate reductase n=1 Tax=Rufibacter glacialis TaxID=1259555 RepID=A0A5M8QE46_9BACT|nr:dihydrofolate reductase family protein [Rufibacter glacialis]KAA6433234.1 dihydrofolate reductase [Rufibacter glacialis]GGK76243.1 diacylglycerol kinase [Rufibacter glacialis]